MSDIYLSLTETPAVVTLSQPVISGALSSTVTVANTVTVALDANSLSALENVTVTVGAAVSVSNFPATQIVAGTVTVGNTVGFLSASDSDSNLTENIAVAMSYNNILGISNPVTIGSLPAISGTVTVGNTVTVAGTVTANPTGTQTVAGTVTASLADVVTNDAYHALPHVRVNGGFGQGVELAGNDANGNPSNIWEGGGIPVYPRDDASPSAPFPVAGTVTVGNTVTVAGTVTANPTGTQTIAGTVTAVLAAQQADDTDPDVKFLQIGYFSADAVNNLDQYHAVSDRSPLPVINTTENLPRGALTTRFGSVTTANTAQLTSAVTNASRKYLLLQNISTAAVTVGVGFVPTTTQGIALAAGAGLTFDAFCPTGAVHWLGATTGAVFTILEG
jgi:hypothetical protein